MLDANNALDNVLGACLNAKQILMIGAEWINWKRKTFVDSFTYLGCNISKKDGSSEDVKSNWTVTDFRHLFCKKKKEIKIDKVNKVIDIINKINK